MVRLNCTFPDQFFEEEERCGYKVSTQMKKIWAVELDLLKEFARVCTKYNITFYLDGGSLLGAVRHQGIIPWDDDIDVMMFRKDYNKLCEIGNEEFHHPYFFQTEYTDKGTLRGHIQLRNSETTGILKSEYDTGRHFNQGIFLDIFPLDNVPNDMSERENYLKSMEKLRKQYKKRASQTIYYKFRLRKNIFAMGRDLLVHMLYKIWPSCSFCDYEAIYKKSEILSQSYNNTETENVVLVPFYKNNYIRKRSWYRDIVYLPFEFMSMPAPIDYDELLTKAYGDYHKYVIGTSIHGGIIFDTEKSYKEYL
ncbi:MAG: LicD family protein [Prevotellaceae bacterium]|nr:LicD family protein [Prevotellaceae bacterium]